jgi:hypothetical protein
MVANNHSEPKQTQAQENASNMILSLQMLFEAQNQQLEMIKVLNDRVNKLHTFARSLKSNFSFDDN